MDIVQKWPNEIVLIRHGQSERNVAKDAAKAAGAKPSWVDMVRDQDTPLTDLGRGQALAVGVNLRADYPYDVMIVSPYLRTLQTAELILDGLGYDMPMVLEDRIREIEFGILDGLTPDGVFAKYPEEIARRKKEGKYWYRPPGGESRPDVALRVHSLLGTLARDFTRQRLLIVCHSVVVLVFRRLLERWSEEMYLQIDRDDDVKNCSITRYRHSDIAGKLQLAAYNEIVY